MTPAHFEDKSQTAPNAGSDSNGKTKRYEQIAAQITAQVEQGALQSGQKVPSLQRLRKQFGVSLSTAIRAYSLLEKEGLLECRPQSGFYVAPRPPVPPQPPPKVHKASDVDVGFYNKGELFQIRAMVEKELFRTDSQVLHLGTIELNPELLPLAALQKSIASGPRRVGSQGYLYNWPPGDLSLRRQLARHYLDRGLSLSPNDFLTTTGCTEGIQLCLGAVAKPGDLVAVESPTCPWTQIFLQRQGLKVLEIPVLPHKGMDLDYLEKALHRNKVKACLIIPSFQNPTGSLMPEAHKRRLVEMLSGQDIPLIENDINGDLHFEKTAPKPAKAFDKKGLVMICSSFSKTLATGLRVGWITPGKYYGDIKISKILNTMTCNVMTESALGSFMEQGLYRRFLAKARKFYFSNLQAFLHGIGKYFPKGTRVLRPQGGLTLWVEFPKDVDSFRLCREALAEKIFVVPGPFLSSQGKFRNCIRVTYGYPWSEKVEKAMERLGGLAKRQLAEARN
jgi:DNA-binding transcriptional MocR family regulator